MTDSEAARAEHEKRLADCEAALGHRFTDRSLLELALTHSSLRDPWTASNERLEFLGDSVLGLAVSEHLFCILPDRPEGELTRIRSLVVSKQALARVGKELDLKKFLRVGKGIRAVRSIPDSLVANTLEALIGAVYLDAGFETARDLVLRHIDQLLGGATRRGEAGNYKAALQQITQKRLGKVPTYVLVATEGPDHRKEFVVAAAVGERTFPAGRGSSKKQAEQRAARLALRALKVEHGSDAG